MKFQNPSLYFFWTDKRMHAGTDKPKPICSPLFQSWGIKKKMIFFFLFLPIDLLIVLYQLTKLVAPSCYSFWDQLTKFVAPSSYSFWDIIITNIQSQNLQREIIRK